jgi:hypothetical protein
MGLSAPNDHQCELCGKSIHSRRALVAHIKSVHERVSLELKCTHCDEIFINKTRRMRHINLVHFPEK